MGRVTIVGITETEQQGRTSGIDRFLQTCQRYWPQHQPRPRVAARAPGRLDCMGGMADFSGTLALQMPIERAVYVAAGHRSDQKVHVQSIGWNHTPDLEWPLSVFYQSDGQFVTASALAKLFESCPWVRHVAGVLLAFLESGDIPHFAGGVTLVLQSEVPCAAGLGASAAIQVAVAIAMAALFEVELDAQQLARVCRSSDLNVVGTEPGLVDHLTCLLGESDSLLQIRSQPDDVLGTLSMPKDVIFAGVDADLRLPLCDQRYADNRTASLMGRFLIEKILKASGAVGDPTGGYLANIAPNEYVDRFRDQLPVKMRGKEFLAHVPASDDLDVTVQPDQIYKIRSRTEHHIYENDRAHRFMERLSRVRRTGERDALVEAGDLMYASHWSYSQRCGMGSIETDILVNAIRERGPVRGLYGAKVTGKGCGGTVAVLMNGSPQARAALNEACDAYAAKTARVPCVLIGSSAGAIRFGTRSLD
jgi:galactokinase